MRRHSIIPIPSRLLVSCLLAALWVQPTGSSAQTTFAPQQVVENPFTRVSAISVAPLDGDDEPDVFALSEETNRVSVIFNGGGGGSWSASDQANGERPRQTSFGDIDGDDDVDLVFTDWNSKRIYLLRNRLDETGDFARSVITTISGRPDGVMVVDVDLDTDLDIVFTNRAHGSYHWIENVDGNGSSWTRRNIGSATDGAQTVWAGDIDDDGDIDVAGGAAEEGGQLIWWENTDGAATTWAARPITTGLMISIDGGDVDGDGDIDLLVSEAESLSQPDNSISWFENVAGDGSSWNEHLIGVGPNGAGPSRDIQLADLDRDGDLDAAGAANGHWFQNVSGDASTWSEHTGGPGGPFGFDAADADGDGDLDLFSAIRGSNRIVWSENLKCDPDDDDDDGDGYVNGCDLCPGGDDGVDADGDLIPDDCEVRSIAIDNVTLAEGTGGTTDFVFTVTLTGDAPTPFSVDYSTSAVTATAGSDYDATPGTIFFAGDDGETQTITVSVAADAILEPDETFTVELEHPSDGGTLVSDSSGLGTIEDDDASSLSIDDVTALEGAAGTTGFVFTVTLSGPVQGGVSVDYATADGTATAPGDYAATSGTLSFDGSTAATQTVTVFVDGDDVVEVDETFTVDLSNISSSGVTPADLMGVGTIQNDDAASLTINDATVFEGDGGSTTNLIFTLTLSGVVEGGFSVPFETADGSGANAATAGEDYVSTSGNRTFFGFDGETKTVTVTVLGDDGVEADETLLVQLGTPTVGGVGVADAVGEGTLLNDDTATLTIDDPTVVEGDGPGTSDLVYTVTLHGDLPQGFTVSFHTANGSASAGADYTAAADKLAFTGTEGETQTVTVTVTGDDVTEDDETVLVVLGTPSHPDVEVVPDSVGVGTIENDDTATLEVDDPTVVEGNSGSSSLVFTITVAGEVDDSFTVSYATADGTGVDAATASEDYTPTTGNRTFSGFDGETETVTVTILGDAVVEPDETFELQLGLPSNDDVLLGAPGVGTIENDDIAFLTIGDTAVVEGADGTTTGLVFTVSLSGDVEDGFSVPFQTTSGGSATAGEDYVATSGSVAFDGSDGETGSVSVTVNGDAVVESDETVLVGLGEPSTSGVVVLDASGTGTIQDDDSATVSIGDALGGEGDSGTTAFSFEVTLTGGVQGGFTVAYATQDDTATTAGGDYRTSTG